MTAPPLKAIRMALLIDSVAACVVRTLATTAIRIPMKPAESEQNAPITKPMAVGRSLKMKSKMKMITAIELIVIT